METRVLIDKLDDVLRGAKQVPLTDQVRVDREEVFDLLDQLRVAVMNDFKNARGDAPAASSGNDGQALAETVTEAIRATIPEIARAVAAASSPGPSAPPPGGPF
jgi:hypothetical protein